MLGEGRVRNVKDALEEVRSVAHFAQLPLDFYRSKEELFASRPRLENPLTR